MLFADFDDSFLLEAKPPDFDVVAPAFDLSALYNSRCSQFFLLRTFLNSLMSVEGEDFEGENLMLRVGIHQVRESRRGPAENAIKVLEKKLPSHGRLGGKTTLLDYTR